MLLNDGYQKEAHTLPYIIAENSRPIRTFPFGIYCLFWSIFSYSRSFFVSFILSLSSSFLSFSLFSKTYRISSFFTTRNIKAKIFQYRPLRCSSLSQEIKFKLFRDVTNMGDYCICHDFSAGKHAQLLFTSNQLGGQQPGFSSLSVLINNKRQ